MKKWYMELCVFFVACFIIASSVITCRAEAVDTAAQQAELKQACISATITAIQLETDRHQKWLEMRRTQGDTQGVRELEQTIAQLQADLEKYRNMAVDDYILPEKVVVPAWVQNPAGEGVLLYVDGMTKSGPFYHLTGIKDGNYAVLAPNDRYNVTFYRLYPRSYWNMECAYVYVAEVRQ